MGIFDRLKRTIVRDPIEILADDCFRHLHQIINAAGISSAKKHFLFRVKGKVDVEIGFPSALAFLRNDRVFAQTKIESYDCFIIIGMLETLKNNNGRTDSSFFLSEDGKRFINAASVEAARLIERRHKDSLV